MLTLSWGDWQAGLLPEQGAAFARLTHAGLPVLAPLPDGADPNATPAGAFLMLPWTNRLDAGRMGGHAAFAVNRPAEGTAIHGLSRAAPWAVIEAGPARAVLAQRVEAGPYRYAARLEVGLGPAGFALALALTHEGEVPLPHGLGWHPWFHRAPGTRLDFAATHRLSKDARNLPIAAEPSTGMTGALEAAMGLDAHFPGWAGEARLAWPGRAALNLRAGGALARNLHVFVPGYAEAVCLEPVSHVPDVINRPALAPFGAMAMLAPGETLRGEIALAL